MATIELSFHDYFNIGAPIRYDQGFYYDDPRLTYDCSLESDSLAKQVSVVKSDTVSFSDQISKSPHKSISDSVGFSDVLAKSFTKAVADTINFSDEIAKGFSLVVSDSISFSDSLAKSFGLNVSDKITFTDLVHVSIPLRRSVLDVESVHVGLDLDSVSVEGLDAIVPKYDGTFLYDQEGLYYDKLYSPTDNFSQGEEGRLSTRPVIVGIDSKKIRVEIGAKKPIVAVTADKDSTR